MLLKLTTLLTAVLFSIASAAAVQSTGVSRTTKKISKKRGAKTIKMKPPQVLQVGDQTIGVRGARGGAWEGSTVLGANYQYMYHPNFSVGAYLGHTSYETSIAMGPWTGKWDYRVMTVVGLGSMHFDMFQVQNLDTYVTLGLGRSFIKSSFSSNVPVSGISPSQSADADATFFVGYFTARYFFQEQFAVTGSIGLGLGNLGIGLDYLF